MTPHLKPTLRDMRRFFDERASRWDAIVSPEHPVRLRRILRRLEIAPKARVLDVGCGTGVLYPILADMLDAEGVVVAVDAAFQMARAAAARMAADSPSELAPARWAVQADIAAPPLANDLFDWVICNSCFPHFDDQLAALRAMGSLLRSNGLLAVCHTESRAAINAFHHSVGGLVGGHELPTATVMTEMTAQAGLELLSLEDETERYLLIARKSADA